MQPASLVHSARLRLSQVSDGRVAQRCDGVAQGGHAEPGRQATSHTGPFSSWQLGLAAQLETGVASHVWTCLFAQTWVEPQPPPQRCSGPDVGQVVSIRTSHAGMLAHELIGTSAQLGVGSRSRQTEAPPHGAQPPLPSSTQTSEQTWVSKMHRESDPHCWALSVLQATGAFGTH
jgi:hypothetical protein